MGITERLIRYRRIRIARELLLLYGVEMPAAVRIGRGFRLEHRGLGTVIHPDTVIGDDVTIYHQVTIGRADGHLPRSESPMERVEIGDGAVLFPGAKVLGGPGVTRIGARAIVAANAVVTQPVPDGEVWGGIPARKIGDRPLRLAL